MYANKNYKTDGKVYYMPNKIFDENFSPHEFIIYCFLVSVGDSKGVSFWSVPKIAKKCNMCPTTCRNTLKSLEEKGYIDITQRFFENAQQSNIYTVHQIQCTPLYVHFLFPLHVVHSHQHFCGDSSTLYLHYTKPVTQKQQQKPRKKESTICNQPCKWHPFLLIIHSVKLSFNRRSPSAYSVRKSPSSRP